MVTYKEMHTRMTNPVLWMREEPTTSLKDRSLKSQQGWLERNNELFQRTDLPIPDGSPDPTKQTPKLLHTCWGEKGPPPPTVKIVHAKIMRNTCPSRLQQFCVINDAINCR